MSKVVRLNIEVEVQEGAEEKAVIYVITNVLRHNGIIVKGAWEAAPMRAWDYGEEMEDYA